jgi:hypothetical protein
LANLLKSPFSPAAFTRRTFAAAFAGVLLAPGALLDEPDSSAGVKLSFPGRDSGPVVPADFIGLSYEAAQLANPDFFSSSNGQLVGLFRELAPKGNLRIGGGSSEYTTYSDEPPTGVPPFEVFGPDTSKTVKSGTVTTELALRNLRGFLDSVNWSCLYGLNLGQGTVENAVREASAVHRILGPRLLAFQIGNEPDSFRKRYRPESYTPTDFLAEWRRFHDAIVSAVPQAHFAGPDISNKLQYLTAFAEIAPHRPDIVLLTSHYYAMGPAGNPGATLENLLSPNPQLTTLKARDYPIIQQAEATAQLPYRMSEGNSCWDGGKPGVSDTFASALWVVCYLLTCMGRGWAGANLHGGGNGYYTPIAGSPSVGFVRRPEYLGIKLAARFVGAQPAQVVAEGAPERLDVFRFARGARQELVVVNKTETPIILKLPPGTSAAQALSLTAPAIDAKEGVELAADRRLPAKFIKAAEYSATVYSLHIA